LKWVTAAIAHAGEVKERMDKFDDATKTLGYTVLEGDPRYSCFSSEMKFVSVGETSCEAIWTATYEPVGDMGPPEHIKQIVVLVFKTLERAVLAKKTLSYTEVLDASPDAIWKASKHADELLLKELPEYFASITWIKGHGEPGSIRVVKLGPGMKNCPRNLVTQAAFLHTNYSRNTELSSNNLAILPVIYSSKNKNSCCSESDQSELS
jgi:hypothetical protein